MRIISGGWLLGDRNDGFEGDSWNAVVPSEKAWGGRQGSIVWDGSAQVHEPVADAAGAPPRVQARCWLPRAPGVSLTRDATHQTDSWRRPDRREADGCGARWTARWAGRRAEQGRVVEIKQVSPRFDHTHAVWMR